LLNLLIINYRLSYLVISLLCLRLFGGRLFRSNFLLRSWFRLICEVLFNPVESAVLPLAGRHRLNGLNQLALGVAVDLGGGVEERVKEKLLEGLALTDLSLRVRGSKLLDQVNRCQVSLNAVEVKCLVHLQCAVVREPELSGCPA